MRDDMAELLATLPAEDDKAPGAAGAVLDAVSTRPLPTGRASRLWSMGSLQARVAAAYALCRARELFAAPEEQKRLREGMHLANALRLLDGMGYLRGALLKVGQTLAAYPNVAPDAWSEVLGALHSEAPPMHFSLLREQLRRDLRAEPEEAFGSFETRAFAAASLGQVHRATLRTGEPVAVKVQYPGIARALKADFDNARALFRLMPFLRERETLAATLENITTTLLEETDYRREAAMADEVRGLLAGLDDVVVPRVHRSVSGDRTLTTDLLEGDHLAAFLAKDPTQEERDRRGAQMLRVAARLYYSGRLLLGDPNPGNFLFLPDGRLGVIDFGCYRRFDEADWEAVLLVIRSFRSGWKDFDRVMQVCALLTDEELKDEERMRFHRELCDWTVEPVRDDRPFDFGNPEFLERGFRYVRIGTEKRWLRQRPVFLWQSRSFFGLRASLFRMRARVNEKRIDDEEIARAGLAVGPGRDAS